MDRFSIIIYLLIPIILIVGYILHKLIIHHNQEKPSSLIQNELLNVTNETTKEYLDNLIDKYSAMGYNGYLVHQYKESEKKSYPTNCKNCGAPLHSHHCEFCDTEYN